MIYVDLYIYIYIDVCWWFMTIYVGLFLSMTIYSDLCFIYVDI